MRRLALLLLPISLLLGTLIQVSAAAPLGQQSEASQVMVVEPGDTWEALAHRFDVESRRLQLQNQVINTALQPAIGSNINVPNMPQRLGQTVRTDAGGLLAVAAQQQINPWALTLENTLTSPFRPTLRQPLFVAGGDALAKDLPSGFSTMEMSHLPAQPGLAVGFRAILATGTDDITGQLEDTSLMIAVQNDRLVGLVGTGAFQQPGDLELRIHSGDEPVWSQPWRFAGRQWTFQQLTLTGEAAAIDQESIIAERERLQTLWSEQTPEALWQLAFAEPVQDYLEISADYGGRRSYNGGPYRSYHEGVDYSAYRGTPVLAPASGIVVLAEDLYVRGGAVIIDHGLGVYSGYYHLSAIHATPGTAVQPGDLLGEVGTTGLSTGNHLHWDLLINGVWVDAAAWRTQGMDCWILEGLGTPCETDPS